MTTTTTTTLGVAIRTTAESDVVVAAGVDNDLADALRDQIDELRPVTESLRGLGFLGPPPIAIETPQGFAGRWAVSLDNRLDTAGLAVETRLMQLLALLPPGQDIRSLILSNISTPSTAFYDEATGELVVAATSAQLDALQRAEVVGQLVRVLTDQYHDYTARTADLRAAGDDDAADALEALALADALYSELRYVESLPAVDQQAVAERSIAVADGPRFVVQELSFVGDAGIAFVGEVLESGGTAALDSAYGAPLTTESLLHPGRFMAGEGVLELAAPQADLPGYSVHHAGTLGELGLRSLLDVALTPGMLTQTSDGWGADHEIVFYDNDDVAVAYLYRGDGGDDTVEVAQAFLNHAAFVMGMAEPIAAGGGVEIVGLAADDDAVVEGGSAAPAAGPYVFVDRTGDTVVVIIASDIAAGRRLRSQLAP